MYYVLMKCTGYEMSKIIKSMNPENVLLVVQRTFMMDLHINVHFCKTV